MSKTISVVNPEKVRTNHTTENEDEMEDVGAENRVSVGKIDLQYVVLLPSLWFLLPHFTK